MYRGRDSQNLDSTFAGAVYIALLARDGTARAPNGGHYFSAAAGGPLQGLGSNNWIGSAVAGVGDIDGNGVPDMVVSRSVGRRFSLLLNGS